MALTGITPSTGSLYDRAEDSPYANKPFKLTKSFWENKVFHNTVHDMEFMSLIGPKRSNAAIIYDASAVQPGNFARIPLRRVPGEDDSPDAFGDKIVTDYASIGAHANVGATRDMNWAYLDVYSGRVRWVWRKVGKESSRMLADYGELSQASMFLSERAKTNWENEIIRTLSERWSASLTTSGTFAGLTRAGAYVFKRSTVFGTAYDITDMPHPNCLFADGAARITALGADADYDVVLAAIATRGGTAPADVSLNVDNIEQLRVSVIARKIKQLDTPYGKKWVCLIAPEVAADLRTDSDFVAAQQGAAPRSYSENVLWNNAVGVYAGFLFIESSYVKNVVQMGFKEDDGSTALTDTTVFPCYIVGANAMAMSNPGRFSMSTETLDGGNITYLYGESNYGLVRADWLDDTGAALTYECEPGLTGQDVWNHSSAILFVYSGQALGGGL